jgi:tRNA threonylcarbamoyladenosine biosynthesis protein TsaE
MQFVLHNINDLPATVTSILQSFPNNRLWLLYGHMGAGKTSLIKEFCKQLGVTDETSSPTFSIINEYHTHNGGRVYHSDLYRLKKPAEVIDAGLEDILYSTHHVFIEWPEIAENILPEENIQISISANENGERMMDVK